MWELNDGTAIWILIGAVGLIALLVLRRPLMAAVRLLGRTAAGIGVLALFSPVGKLIGVTLGVNLVNALVLAVLGAPGFALLMMVKWLAGQP